LHGERRGGHGTGIPGRAHGGARRGHPARRHARPSPASRSRRSRRARCALPPRASRSTGTWTVHLPWPATSPSPRGPTRCVRSTPRSGSIARSRWTCVPGRP
jgi:hypothetical protein